MAKVSIQIVTWNSLRFLPDCLESIFNQTWRDFSVLIIDNNSHDQTVEYVSRNWPQVKILKNSRNSGYSRAHNQGIMATDSEYVLVLNPDIILEPDFLARLVEIADKKKRVGSFAPKLLKMKFHHIDHCDQHTPQQQSSGAMINPDWCVIKTDLIDSTGLVIRKTRRVLDRGQGEPDTGQYDKKLEIFGVSGACAFYRRKALEDIRSAVDNFAGLTKSKRRVIYEYFDKDFFAYQEDIDLAWRLAWRGWEALYVPEAQAYHVRRVAVSHRLNQSGLVNFLSFRNHLWLLIKNEAITNFLRDFFYIFSYQAAKILYLLLTRPLVLLKSETSFWSKTFLMFKKRRQIFKRAKIKAGKIRKYIE